jgi:hypothetical protein
MSSNGTENGNNVSPSVRLIDGCLAWTRFRARFKDSRDHDTRAVAWYQSAVRRMTPKALASPAL